MPRNRAQHRRAAFLAALFYRVTMRRIAAAATSSVCWPAISDETAAVAMKKRKRRMRGRRADRLFTQTVTRMFERERGVIILERSESLHKRSYRSIRISHAVYERVFRRLTVK
jgi:hypothetical protein